MFLKMRLIFFSSAECASNGGNNLCQNGGSCRQKEYGGYTCNCPTYYSGPYCETGMLYSVSSDRFRLFKKNNSALSAALRKLLRIDSVIPVNLN